MGLIVVQLVFSALALTLFNLLALLRKRIWAWVIGGGLWALLFLASLPSFIASCQMALLTIVGLAMAWSGTRAQRWYLMSSGFIVVNAYGLSWLMGLSALREYDELRQRYPLVSMSDRLAYETKLARRAVPAGVPASNVNSTSNIDINLDDERRSGTPIRVHYLRQLHEEMTNAFVASDGFGVGRMIRVRPGSIESQDRYIESDHGVVKMEPASDEKWKAGYKATNDPIEEGQRSQFQQFHRTNAIDFVNRQGFGYIRDRDHVAGFIPHEFSGYMPEAVDTAVAKSSGRRFQPGWRAARIELVSLLKFDEPGVYQSDHLPRMDELTTASTRPLNYFESNALAELRGGQDLVVERHGSEIRMLGALRAGKTCIKCHQVEPGEMLGAFSYRLTRNLNPIWRP